jgi:hypothetical protein
MAKKGMTVLEYAIQERKTLDWVYKQCRLGRLPAVLRDGRWTILVSGNPNSQGKGL